jgi:hypothetical protein
VSGETSDKACEDTRDDDCDGTIDCLDQGCIGTVVCPKGPEKCADGLDNDLDRYIDCADSECQGTKFCPISCGIRICLETSSVLTAQ